MVLPTRTIASRIIPMALICSGVCLTAYSSMRAGQSVPIGPEAAGNKDTKKDAENADKMFPDGVVHDFGTVLMGKEVMHAFRVVNTSNIPLRIVSLHKS
jgi:hypothetical protein